MTQVPQTQVIADRLAELGHPTRLEIFRFLVKSGRKGSPVGEIQQQLEIPASTLSHHIAKLMKVGLLEQNRQSRTLYCIPKFAALKQVVNYLEEECCKYECC